MNTNDDLPWDIKQANATIQGDYLRMVKAGVCSRAAEMFALQSPPGVKGTDRSLMHGRSNNQQFDDMPKDHALGMISMAKDAGINPNGKYYFAGLADKRGFTDPEAWVSSAAEVKDVAHRRNLTVTGAVEHAGIPQPPPPHIRLSERLTREMMRAEKPMHPTMKKGELREMVVSKYGRKRKGQ